jgi:phage shock protein E
MIAFFKRLLGLDGAVVARISPQEAQLRLKNGALLIDVRSLLERQRAKIAGSQAMPLDQLSQHWEALPKDCEIICQCASGMRSAQAASFLAGKGLNASNLAGGINAWQSAGLPVKQG